jgi:tripartite-type tricarboxylate transporter receptor subunit TctC
MVRCVRVLFAAALVAAGPAAAQDWPTKPVRFVVPFPPGGSVDPLARLLGAKLGESLGVDLNVSTPAALQKWTLEQMAHWGRIVKENGIKAD